ncbi:MAG: hypothetical protein ACI8S6_004463, partial [Myxococcota bacterium]
MEQDQDAEAIDYARQDLTAAVEIALRRDGHLLTAGELRVTERFLALPPEAASLYARLHSRRPSLFRLEQLDYAEVGDIPRAATVLCEAGLAHDENILPATMLLSLRTVAELKVLCREHGRRRSGKRAALLERLTTPPLPREAVNTPALLLRHRRLFRRLCRLYLHDHSGDLS